jgi:hypothetical protein
LPGAREHAVRVVPRKAAPQASGPKVDFVPRDHLLPNRLALRSDAASTVCHPAPDHSVDALVAQVAGHSDDHYEARCQEPGHDFHQSALAGGRVSRDE